MKVKIAQRFLSGLKPTGKVQVFWDTEIPGLCLRVAAGGGRSYSLLYRNPDGERKRYTLPGGNGLTAAQVRSAARVVLGRIARGEDPSVEKSAKRKDVALRQFLDGQYGEWAIGNLKDGALRVKQIEYAFPGLLNLPLSKITTWKLEAWRMARRKSTTRYGKPPREVTLNRQITILSTVLEKAREWGALDAPNPTEAIKLGKVDGGERTRTLDAEEMARLTNVLNEWAERYGPEEFMRPCVILAIHTGLRKSEMLGLVWRNVDTMDAAITVPADIAKNGHSRVVPLSPTALKILTEWEAIHRRDDDAPVFAHPRYGVHGNVHSLVDRRWRRIRAKAKLQNFRWHDLRHVCASMLLEQGETAAVIAAILGQKSGWKLAERYSHVLPASLRKAVAKLPGPEANVVPFPAAEGHKKA